jgi:putative ABC transport system permease protein
MEAGRSLRVRLIAFNTTSIGVDERAREHATMLAFGLPALTVLGMTTVETVLVGALGTITRLAGGLHPDHSTDPYIFRVDLSEFGIGTSRVVFSREPGAAATAFPP